VQLALALDAERCQVSVGREVARRSELLEEAEEDLRVPVAGMESGDVRARQPRAYDVAAR